MPCVNEYVAIRIENNMKRYSREISDIMHEVNQTNRSDSEILSNHKRYVKVEGFCRE